MSVLAPPWVREGYSRANFDPAWQGYFDRDGSQAIGELWRYLLRTSAGGGGATGFETWEYVRPRGPLYHEVKVPGCGGETAIIPSAAGGVAFAPGQSISVGVNGHGAVILGRPPSGLVGVGGFATDDIDAGAFDEIEIESVSPATLTVGVNDQAITITGRNFRQTPLDSITAAVYDGNEASSTFGQYTADPYVTLHGLAWVSSSEATALANVTASAPNGYIYGLRGVRA